MKRAERSNFLNIHSSSLGQMSFWKGPVTREAHNVGLSEISKRSWREQSSDTLFTTPRRPIHGKNPERLTTHFQHQKSTHFQHRLTPNTKNSLPTPNIDLLPTQNALFGVEGESVFRFPIGNEASLLEPHHKQTLQGK